MIFKLVSVVFVVENGVGKVIIIDFFNISGIKIKNKVVIG